MSQFNTLSIQSIHQLTPDSVEVAFDVPSDLADAYSFDHGQFVMLRATIDGEVVERAYSICRAPYERKLNVAVKRVDGGLFSSYVLNDLSKGDHIEVSEPCGTFTCSLDSSRVKHYLLVAAGSGITPVMSILKTILASEPKSQCVFLFGNKSAESVMFLDEVIALKGRYQSQLQIDWVFSKELVVNKEISSVGDIHAGRIDSALVDKILKNKPISSITEIFICGPEEMTLDLQKSIFDQGVAQDAVNIELFSNGGLSDVVDEGASNSRVSLMIDGDEVELIYDDATESILEHALRIDPDLPYGCQNGSCGACQVKVVSGKVGMATNYALSKDEVDDGYVLLCQARPESNVVKISYDE